MRTGSDEPNEADAGSTSDVGTSDVQVCAASDFGDGGIAVFPLTYWGLSLQVQADGKFVTTSGDEIFRFDAHGKADQTFGSGGIVTTPTVDTTFCCGFNPIAVRVTPSEHLVLTREVAPTSTQGSRSVLRRFDSTGTLETSFGDGGLSDELPPNAAVLFYGMTTLSDDSIVGVGLVSDDSTILDARTDLLVAKYTANGHLDSSFGQGGIVRQDLGSFDVGHDVVVDGSGNIVVVGCTGTLDDTNVVLVRFGSSGKLDTTFGTNGVSDSLPVVYGHECSYLETDNNVFAGFVLAPNGTFVVATHSGTPNLARFTASGKLDPTFGGTGMIHPYVIGGMAVTNNGSVLVTRSLPGDGGFALPEFVLNRYRIDGTLDEAFGDVTIGFPGQWQSVSIEQKMTTGGLLMLGRGDVDAYTSVVNFAKLSCVE